MCAFYDETRHLAGPLSLPPEGGTSYERENSQNERLGERGRWNPERLLFPNRPSLSFSLPWAAIPQPIPDFFKDALWPPSPRLREKGHSRKTAVGEVWILLLHIDGLD